MKSFDLPSRELRVADSPEIPTIFQALRERYGFDDALRATGRPKLSHTGPLISLPLSSSRLRAMREAAGEAIETHGLHGWLHTGGRAQSSAYESLSLTYNPDQCEPGVDDIHQSTLGTARNSHGEFFYGADHTYQKRKHSYFDTYGFRKLTPAATIGGLGKFLKQCRLSLVRSRLSVLYGDAPENLNFDFGWHRDESVFENLRINIPLVANRRYRLQIENDLDRPDISSKSMSSHYLRTGFAYTFDTHRPHRVFAATPSNVVRVHLVLGFSPWFDYNESNDSWAPNEFFGKIHPLDIASSGALHPLLCATNDVPKK